MATLLTLPPQLLEKIQAILDADLGSQLDGQLRADLQKATEDAAAQSRSASEVVARAISDKRGTPSDCVPDTDTVTGTKTGTDRHESPVKEKAPAVIDEEVLLSLSRWATSDLGQFSLKRKAPDPLDYSMIALLAGTEVYVPPAVLARIKAAENPDKRRSSVLIPQPDPLLPSYLSPAPPSLGSEYRALTRNLSTVFNILFSIFGSAGAVYAAGVSGAGYTRETAMLLAILTGVVVGIADGVLVWIFSERVKKTRREGERLGREMARGSAGLGVKDNAKDQDQGAGDEVVRGTSGDGDVRKVKERREIILRRRAVGDKSQ